MATPSRGSQNYRAVVEYDGTAYHGFQVQASGPTIQGELERALQRLAQEEARVHGAGRTDAGVHARGQVISLRSTWRHGAAALERGMNALLPRDIAVRELEPAPDEFHARFSASSRAYVYNLYSAGVRAPLWDRYAHYVAAPLDLAAMSAATAGLVGVHDFGAFGQPPVAGANAVRQVLRAAWQERLGGPLAGQESAAVAGWRFEIEADAFLRGMVRRIVGTLLLVGSGVLAPPEVAEILAARDISRAGVSVPACGLCLWRVRYEPRQERESGARQAPPEE
jgi:tRNA pseudouridine38-40 synthase